MKYISKVLITALLLFLATSPLLSQSLSDAKTYAKLALKHEYGTSYIKDISISIDDWHYNRSKGEYYIYYTASYSWWSVAFWDTSTNKIQLYCDLSGDNARFKFDGFGNSWQNWSSVYPN